MSGLSLKEQALVRAVERFEDIGFMEWHARVLNALTTTPQTVRQLARGTGLFHYHVRGVLADLLALQLVEYTREGIQLVDGGEMLLQLVACCEDAPAKKSYDYEVAFEVALPRVVALEKKFSKS